MNATDDLRLLHQYVSAHSEAAFTTLVQRHLKLVHSAAWRQTCSSQLAEEVTQAVFIALARKAPAIRAGANLSSWLYRATRFAALGALKTERRRHQREQEALRMETESTRDSGWEQIFPLLDEAMAKLRERDRAVVLLRYFEELSLAEVGSTLGITEEAAKKRLSRALEKLRAFFSRRGTTLPAAAIGGLLAANAVQAAPAALAATAAATAWLGGACAAAPTVALAKGILKAFIRAKLQSTVTFGTAAALGLGAAALLIETLKAKPSSQALSQAGRYEFEVTGHVTETQAFYRPEAQGTAAVGHVVWDQPKVTLFTLYARDGKWFIHGVDTDEPKRYREYSYDGQAIYSYARDEGNPADAGFGAVFSPDIVPYTGPNHSFPMLWLAFASSHHLDQNARSIVPPYWTSDRPVLRIDLSRRSDKLRLPERIVFYKPASDSAAAFAKAIARGRKDQDAIYRVSAFTNVNNMDLPLEFELTALREAGPGEDPRKQYPSFKVEGRIDSIKSTCTKSEFVPRLLADHIATINDYRLELPRTTPGLDSLCYQSNKWPTLVELTNLPGFTRFMSQRELYLATGGGLEIRRSNGTETYHSKGGYQLDGSIAAPPPRKE